MLPEVLAATPVRPPPPGVVSNFVDPESNASIAAITIYVTLPVMVLLLGLRLYTRITHFGGVGMDDYWALLASATVVGYCGLVLSGLENPGGGLLGLHIWDIPLLRLTAEFMQTVIATIIIYMAASMLVKISLLMLYLRLFDPIPHAVWMIKGGIVIVVLFYTSCMIGVLALCLPRPSDVGGWLSKSLGARLEGPQAEITGAQAIFGAIVDFYVLAIPLHLVLGLRNLSRGRKIGVTAIFLTGLLGCAASVFSAYYRFQPLRPLGDFAYKSVPTMAACVAELNICLTCGCLPIVQVLLKGRSLRIATYLSSLLRNRRTRRTTSGEKTATKSSMDNAVNKKMSSVRIPNATLTGIRTFIRKAYRSRPGLESNRQASELPIYNSSDLDSINSDYHAHIGGNIRTSAAAAAAREPVASHARDII